MKQPGANDCKPRLTSSVAGAASWLHPPPTPSPHLYSGAEASKVLLNR